MARVRQFEITIQVRAEAKVRVRALSEKEAGKIVRDKLRKKQVTVAPTEEEMDYVSIRKCEEIK